MKIIRSVLSKKKYTVEQKQKWEEEADSSFSSFSSMSSNSESNGQRRSPGTLKDHRGRPKSPGVGKTTKKVHPVSLSDHPGEIKFTAIQTTGIIKSGLTCVLEGHVPRTNADGECTITALGSEKNARDLTFGTRSDEMNPNHTRVPLEKRSAVFGTYSSAGQDRGSSKAYVSHQRLESSSSRFAPEASSSRKQSGRLTPRFSPNKFDQTELTDESTLRQSNPAGPRPPPPCSQCINDHYSVKPPSLRISSDELKIATKSYNNIYDFDEQLFKGSLAGRPVYVERRVSKKSNFGSEVEILKTLQHPNIVTLRGFCDEEDSQALVFNFVCCNRDLLYNLSSKGLKRETMPWPHRVKLAVELAKGLEYLHKSGIIHRNVNSKNVFVTHDFVPVIGDFSLSSRVHDVRDTILEERKDKKARGYLAPEYLLGEKHSEKQDVYAYGVILFELISGRAPFDRGNKSENYLDKWSIQKIKEYESRDPAKLLEAMADPRLNYDFSKKEMLGMISVATLCTREDSKKRPDMKEVLTKLLMGHISDHLAQSQEKPARQEIPAATFGPVRQEKPAAKLEPAPSPQHENLGCFGSRSISPVMQQPIIVSLRNAFGLDPAVPPQDHGDRQSTTPGTSASSKDSGKTRGKKTTFAKAPFEGHPDRIARSTSRKPRPARPRPTDGPTQANANPFQTQTHSPRRSGHGRTPSTPFHRLASKTKLGAPQSPGFPMKTRLLWYNPKNPAAPRMTKEKHRVRFAESRRRPRWNPYK